MTQAERGLFERIRARIEIDGDDYGIKRRIITDDNYDGIGEICAEFERQLHYLGGTVEVLSADKEALEQRLAEAESQLEAQQVFDNTSTKIANDNLDKIAEIEHQRDKALDDYENAMHRVSQLEHYEEMVIHACGELETFDQYRDAMRKLTAPLLEKKHE